MPIDRETRKGKIIIRPAEKIDARTAKALEETLLTALTSPRVVVVIDLARVTTMTAIGLRPLLAAAKRAASIDGRVVLAGVPPVVATLLNESGFSSLFEIHADVDQAIKAS